MELGLTALLVVVCFQRLRPRILKAALALGLGAVHHVVYFTVVRQSGGDAWEYVSKVIQLHLLAAATEVLSASAMLLNFVQCQHLEVRLFLPLGKVMPGNE